ncbi:MAG TPA: tetratricopeptide repeat protein [Opitutaceae bacterium]|nr:tetratricopeptide repeat protein [Opitutaceae bacterium]
MSRPKTKSLVIGLAAAAVIALAGMGGGYFWETSRRATIARQSAPAMPALQNAHPELRRRISAAMDELRDGSRPLETLGELSSLYHANGYLSEASKCYRGLLQLDPDNPRWADLQADIAAGFGNLEEAIPLYRVVIARAPEHEASRIHLGDALLKLNRTAEAKTVFQEALSKNPANAYALLGSARCEIAAEQWAAASENLQKCVRLEPDFGAAWALLATVAERLKNTELSKIALARSGKNARFHDIPDPWIEALLDDCYDSYKLRVAAAVARSAGKDDTAARLLERTLRLTSDDPAAHRELGKLRSAQKDFSEARAHLRRAVEFAPDDSENWIAYVVMAQSAGDIPDATRSLLAGLAHNPNSPGLRLLNGRRLAALRDYDAALAEFVAAQKLRPNEADAFVEIALVDLRRGQIDAAVQQLNAALNVELDHPMALLALIRISIDRGERKTADELLARAALQSRIAAADLNDLQSAYQAKFSHESH